MVSALPLSGAFESGGLRLPGVTYQPGQGPGAQYSVVAGDYFKAAGIRLIAGRAFDATDDPAGRSTIIINRVAARQLFGSESAALGRDLIAMFEFTRSRPPRTIVGVVDDVKQLSADEQLDTAGLRSAVAVCVSGADAGGARDERGRPRPSHPPGDDQARSPGGGSIRHGRRPSHDGGRRVELAGTPALQHDAGRRVRRRWRCSCRSSGCTAWWRLSSASGGARSASGSR